MPCGVKSPSTLVSTLSSNVDWRNIDQGVGWVQGWSEQPARGTEVR